jgi:hypothetical protein
MNRDVTQEDRGRPQAAATVDERSVEQRLAPDDLR